MCVQPMKLANILTENKCFCIFVENTKNRSAKRAMMKTREVPNLPIIGSSVPQATLYMGQIIGHLYVSNSLYDVQSHGFTK